MEAKSRRPHDRASLGLALGLALLMSAAVSASAPSAQAAFNVDASGVMLHGYDPMGPFYKNKALPGNGRFRAKWGGGTYWFSSAEYRRWFLSDPDRFVPRYGGFCAMAVTRGKKVDADPNFYVRRASGVYLFANNEEMRAWLSDEAAHEALAKARWEQIQFIAASDL